MNLNDETKKAALEKKVKEDDPSAKEIKYEISSSDFMGCEIWYIEWKSRKYNKDEALCYATIESNGKVRLFDDGVAAAKFLYDMIERKRNILQRLSEWTLTDLIAALIAVVVTTAFALQLLIKGYIAQEMVTLFGIILGYYFGKNVNLNAR